MTKARVSFPQLLFLVVGSALMYPYTIMPILHTPNSNQDVWIVLILSMFYVVLINLPIYFLITRFRELPFYETCELILGKWVGKFFVFLFLIPIFYYSSLTLLLGNVYVNLDLLPDTPSWAFLLLAIIPIGYAAFKGPGTLSRLSLFITSYMLIIILLFLILGLQLMNFKILQPVLADSNLLNLNKSAFLTAARRSEGIILLLFSQYLKPNFNMKKVVWIPIVFVFVYLLILIPTVLVLGLDVAKNSFNPYFAYSRQVHSYDFIQRVQAFNIMAWFPGMILKIALHIFICGYLLSGIFQAKSYKPFVILFCFLTFMICLLPILDKADFLLNIASNDIFPWVIFPFVFGLPAILLLVYLVRKKKVDPVLLRKKARAALLQLETRS